MLTVPDETSSREQRLIAIYLELNTHGPICAISGSMLAFAVPCINIGLPFPLQNAEQGPWK
jgi:hypothetical protein